MQFQSSTSSPDHDSDHMLTTTRTSTDVSADKRVTTEKVRPAVLVSPIGQESSLGAPREVSDQHPASETTRMNTGFRIPSNEFENPSNEEIPSNVRDMDVTLDGSLTLSPITNWSTVGSVPSTPQEPTPDVAQGLGAERVEASGNAPEGRSAVMRTAPRESSGHAAPPSPRVERCDRSSPRESRTVRPFSSPRESSGAAAPLHRESSGAAVPLRRESSGAAAPLHREPGGAPDPEYLPALRGALSQQGLSPTRVERFERRLLRIRKRLRRKCARIERQIRELLKRPPVSARAWANRGARRRRKRRLRRLQERLDNIEREMLNRIGQSMRDAEDLLVSLDRSSDAYEIRLQRMEKLNRAFVVKPGCLLPLQCSSWLFVFSSFIFLTDFS